MFTYSTRSCGIAFRNTIYPVLIAIFILSISQSYAIPIPNSGSGYEFDFISSDDSGSGIHKNNHYDDTKYTCDTSCKVTTYIIITILSSGLACICGLFILIVYEACIKNIIHACVKNIKKNCRYYKENFCISYGKHTSRDNQCVENQNFQNSELSYYDKFIITYNSMYKKKNTLIPSVLFVSNLSKNIYIHFIANMPTILNV